MIDELNKMTDEELEEIVIKGENLHIQNSRASTAKRILDLRRQKSIQKATQQNQNLAKTAAKFSELPFAGLADAVSKLNEQPLANLADAVTQLNKSLIPNIASANATISALGSLTDSLNTIPQMYAKAIKIPTFDNSQLFSALKNVQSIAGTVLWQDIANSTINSPILNVVKEIQTVPLPQTYPAKPDNTPKPIIPKELAEEITSATSQKADTIFNFPAYKYFFHLETFLREFIKKNVIDPNKNNLHTKIPQEMINEWEEKKKREEENPISEKGVYYGLIEYSDFTDLKRILEKRTTLSLVKHLINEENLKTITSKLHELEPIRLKIAHSRAVTEKEFETLRIYAGKIQKILPS